MRASVILLGLFFGFFLLKGQSAPGQTGAPTKPACESAKTQLEINQCMAAAYDAADKKLNAFYASLKEKVGGTHFAKLQAVQRAWIKYRDTNCEAETALYEGGSIQPAVHSACLERVTRARTAELHVIYDTGGR